MSGCCFSGFGVTSPQGCNFGAGMALGMVSGWWSRVAAVEKGFHRSFSSELDASLCLEEGYELAVNVGASPYATGLFTKPPLFLAAQQYVRRMWCPASLFQIFFLAFLVHQIFRTENRVDRTRAKTKGKSKTAACKSASARYCAVSVVLLAGHRFSLEECTLVVSLFGAIQGIGAMTLAGTALGLYASPSTTYPLVWALYKVLRNTKACKQRQLLRPSSPLLRKKIDQEKEGGFFLLFLAKLGMGCLALVVASTYFLKFALKVKDYQKMDFTTGTIHWIRRAYFADLGLVEPNRDDFPFNTPKSVDVLAPSASLLWYFHVQMFPEMKKMFLVLSQLQPILFAVPLAQELCTLDVSGQASDMHLLTSQFLICNLFRLRYRLTTLCLELVLVCVLLGRTHHRMQQQGRFGFKAERTKKSVSSKNPLPLPQVAPFIAVGILLVSIFLWVTHTLWIYFGSANSNYYWAMAICLALLRLALVHFIIRDHSALKDLLLRDKKRSEKTGKVQ